MLARAGARCEPPNRALAVVSLPVSDARVPADRGLAGLGMLMQLGGSLGVIAAVAVALPAAFHGDRASSIVFFLAALYGVRAAFHRAAGSALLYGTGGHPRRSVLAYVCVAVCHSLVTLLLLRRYVDDALLVRIGALLLAWPVVLATCVSLPRLGRLLRGAVPPPEDHGLTGAAVLMIVLGSAGTLCALLGLAILIDGPSWLGVLGDTAGPIHVAGVAVCAVLLLRSVIHVRAGARAASAASLGAHEACLARYGAVGGATASVVALLVAAVVAIATGSIGVVLVAGMCARAALGAWPSILRRLRVERSFDVYLAGDRAPPFRRAPDAGLSALGWLLVAIGAPCVAQALAGALAAGSASWTAALPSGALSGALAGGLAGESGIVTLGAGWRSLLVGGLQLGAGIALVRASERARRMATIYGVVAAVIAAGNLLLALTELLVLAPIAAGAAPGALMALARIGGAGIELALPAATLWLVGRSALPRAVVLAGRGHDARA